ncbi:ABC transporter ATP-binding protein [Pseudonocardia asaccharolytica DSM 44247 = NBRC 16224]|uniref:ABC transporter ATP-binding protein n=2 Tax=Pseudonocardia asaccharolytica TaxID=54010 RepID=A0A511CWD1_9PSEU|nr:ABC transporter ATP-binding protein [Pseudonocardia asaccharolytica DSM 44247 = NBRC 16224]
MLDVRQVSRSFGGVFAVRDVTLSVADGELRGIIGPNGAGKSTLFNLVSGHLQPDGGTVRYRGARLERRSPHRRARDGIAIVFQGARIFRRMTAVENVMVGAHGHTRCGFVAGALRLPGQHREERAIRDRAWEALEQVGLTAWAHREAESLPLGQQRQLQVARALCGEPRLLLLDEPASGLRAAEREALAALVAELHAGGLTMLLIEHDVGFVTRLADRVTVLDLGEVIAEGTPEEIGRDERVITAYLGDGAGGDRRA